MQNYRLSTSQAIDYTMYFSDDVLSLDNEALLIGRNEHSKNCFIIVDQQVYAHHGAAIERYFGQKTENFRIFQVEGEDENKNLDNLLRIFDALNEFPINRRNEPVILIGGGVATDIGAFATSCFRRGIPHIKVPTTLMGYVDASVGIKTGINYGKQKNRMGSFYPPLAVILDKGFFSTLSAREISNGVGEIIKLGVIKNKALFEALEDGCDELLLSRFRCPGSDFILAQSIGDMVAELEPNLYEDNLERIVDFGHTFSLIFEMEQVVDVKHGEAVSMDILFSCLLAQKRGLMSQRDFDRVHRMILAFNIPIHYRLYQADLLWLSLQERVLHRDGFQRVPVPTGIGSSVFVNDISYSELQMLCAEIQKLERASVRIQSPEPAPALP